MKTTQLKNIIQYISAILKNKRIFNFSNIHESVSQSNLTRFFNKKFNWKKHLWNFFYSNQDMSNAYLVIDDTIIEKPHSKASNTVGNVIRWVFSHTHNKCIKGVQIVFLLLVIGDFRFPIGFRIYDGSKTKIELAKELLSYARNTLKLKRMFVLFDSWYSSKNLMKFIKNYGWYFVCRIKKNRKITKSIKERNCFICSNIGNLDILLVKNKELNKEYYVVTNRLSLNSDEILNWYKKRTVIEEFFRIVKQEFKLKSCQTHSGNVFENHIYMCLFCFCLVEQRRIKLGVTIYKANRNSKLCHFRYQISRWKEFLQNA